MFCLIFCGYLFCCSLVLSSCLVFFWYLFFYVVSLRVLIFCDWGFDICKVILYYCLVVDSFILMYFCFLVCLGGIRDKMCLIMYCRDRSFFFIGKEKGRMFLFWIGLLFFVFFEFLFCWMVVVWIRLFLGRKIGVRIRIV